MLRTAAMSKRLLFSCGLLPLFLLACGPDVILEPGEPLPDDPPRAAWMSEQGTELEGAGLPNPITVDFAGAVCPDGNPCTSVQMKDGMLRAWRGSTLYEGAAVVGMRLQALVSGASATLIVTAAQPHQNPYDGSFAGSEHEYRLLAGAADPCKGKPALPLPGTWTATGNHVSSGTQFTFACQGGVLFKCSDFGYKPYLTYSGNTLAGAFRTLDGQSLHQVCTRMARADYCFNGKSHTVDGTRIDMYDIFKHRTKSGTWPFEAAWGRQDGVICLAKKRWETIPLNGLNCPQVPDPRDRNNDDVSFCDSLLPVTAPTLEMRGAFLYNDSEYIDAGLYRWWNGTDYYTTSRFADWGAKGKNPPGPGYSSSPLAKLGFQGAVFNPNLAAPPANTVALVTYVKGADYLTTTVAPPAGYTQVAREGYIYLRTISPVPAGARPLFSYVNPVTGDSLTTVDAVPPAGYGSRRLLGYLPR
jgi:hypothetical protein